MLDLLLLGALAAWFGCWAARDLRHLGVRRGAGLPRSPRRSVVRRRVAVPDDDGPGLAQPVAGG